MVVRKNIKRAVIKIRKINILVIKVLRLKKVKIKESVVYKAAGPNITFWNQLFDTLSSVVPDKDAKKQYYDWVM